MGARLTLSPPSVSQVMTSNSKDTIAEAKNFNFLAALDLGVLRALCCQRRGSTADSRPSPLVVGTIFNGTSSSNGARGSLACDAIW